MCTPVLNAALLTNAHLVIGPINLTLADAFFALLPARVEITGTQIGDTGIGDIPLAFFDVLTLFAFPAGLIGVAPALQALPLALVACINQRFASRIILPFDAPDFRTHCVHAPIERSLGETLQIDLPRDLCIAIPRRGAFAHVACSGRSLRGYPVHFVPHPFGH